MHTVNISKDIPQVHGVDCPKREPGYQAALQDFWQRFHSNDTCLWGQMTFLKLKYDCFSWRFPSGRMITAAGSGWVWPVTMVVIEMSWIVPSILKKAISWLSYFWRWWQLISGNQPGEPDWRPSWLLRHPHHRYWCEIFSPPSSSISSSPPPLSIQTRPPVIFDWLCISRHSVSASFSILLVCSTCTLPSLSLCLFLTQPSRGEEWWHPSPLR